MLLFFLILLATVLIPPIYIYFSFTGIFYWVAITTFFIIWMEYLDRKDTARIYHSELLKAIKESHAAPEQKQETE